MKKLNLMLAAIVAMLLTACNGGDTISPTSEKIQGPLGEYFEVVAKDYKAKEGKISIEIKRIQAGFPAPWKEGMEVGYSDGQCEPQFNVEFQDADGNVVSKDKTDIVSDKDELNVVAALGVDETATITFCCDKDASKFKMGSTFKVHEETVSPTSYDSNGDSRVFAISSSQILTLDDLAGMDETELRIARNEIFARHGYIFKTDDMKAHFANREWYTPRYNDVSSRLSAIEQSNVAIIQKMESAAGRLSQSSSVEIDDSDDDSENISIGSSDWDAMLNSYEQYVDKYISYIKKAANGDMSALTEYPSLMQKAEEFGNKIQDAHDEMSASQWARYMKITNKMIKAAQEMR